MKRLAIITAIMMATVGLPAATASHLSVGSMTTVGMGPEETPGDPSVPGTETGASDTPYGVGTSTDCYDADSEVSPDEASSALAARDVCGELIYHEDSPKLTKTSSVDQDLPPGSPVGKLDARIGYSQAAGFLYGTGLPYNFGPAGDLVWTGVHTAGNAVGITDGPGKADEEDGGRFQIYTQDIVLPNAFSQVQEETGLWEMNGWNGPPPAMERAVAFITDGQGNPYTQQDLNEDVQQLKDSGALHEDTKSKLCGFTPDSDYTSTTGQTFCQIRFYYQGPGEDGATDTKFDGYGDKCNSPSYVCALEGGYWRSRNVGIGGVFGGQTQQTDVYRLHYVLAPHPDPDCVNTKPKQLSFSKDGGTMPYLGHDLDVYTTATDVSNGPDASIDGATSYGQALSSQTPSVPGLPSEVQDALDQASQAVDQASEPVLKDDRVEPNSADTGIPIEDNSRLAISEDRGEPTACQKLVDSESEQTRDPWVNLIDGQVDGVQDDSINGGIAAYGSSDDTQDASNRPGPSLVSTEGKIGVFADKNDDGDYDQVTGADDGTTGGSGVFQSGDIQETGAYPMMWDMRIEEGTQDDPQNAGGGCAGPGGGFSGVMGQAGYGPETALAQAIYLREPTAFTDADAEDPQVVEYPGGNNIYVLTNNAGRVLWDADEDHSNDVDARIDTLVSELRNLVKTEYGASGPIDVHEPGDELGLGSDYFGQCGESTGGFTSQLSFAHDCTVECTGDTVATMYTYEVQGSKAHPNTIGENGTEVPVLTINDQIYQFGTGQHTWYDLDPLDNDPSRNAERKGPPQN